MQLSAHPAAVRLRAVLPAVGEIVYAVGSLWISATVLRNWPDPRGYWRDTDARAYALLAAIYPPLALRRRFPVAVLVSAALRVACHFTLGYCHVVAVCGLALALYTVASLRDRRVSARCAAGALLVLLWGTRLAEPGIGPLSVGFVTATVTTIVCWVTGDGSRRLREPTRRLRREQEEQARRAVMEERIQIARALHDVIAQQALAERRRMLVVLRDDDRAPRTRSGPGSPGSGAWTNWSNASAAPAGVRVSAAAPGSTGQGLIGMCERATIHHGTVTTAPAADGGFEASLRVPVPRTATGARAHGE
ncbi:DUF7134 domain-containing protein [Streptomyces vinaceus]|uniref:DUF7134 domain-containing protein n=1 Tax=Streptomyces vinaceus TaxID=1960 RepID=UPI0037F754D0